MSNKFIKTAPQQYLLSLHNIDPQNWFTKSGFSAQNKGNAQTQVNNGIQRHLQAVAGLKGLKGGHIIIVE